MPNVELERPKHTSIFRRVAISTWRQPAEASMYGSTEIAIDAACDYIEEFRAATGRRLTLTHLIARGIAQALVELPEAHTMLRFNRLYLRKKVGVSLVVMVKNSLGKTDLSMATLRDVGSMSLEQIVTECDGEVRGVRSDTGSTVSATRKVFGKMPSTLLRVAFRSISFLSYDLNLDLRRLGIPRDPFGSVIITNVGSFGLSLAHAPLIPLSKVPIMITVGAVAKTPVVVDDEIVIRRMLRLNVTIDHRCMDGYHAAKLTDTLTRCLEHPLREFGDVPGKTSDAHRAALGAV